MPIDIYGRDRQRAVHLFETLPATCGCVTAGLGGEFGRMWVDDLDAPTVAHLHLDFHFLVGDHRSPVADEMVREFSARLAINTTPEWVPLLRSIHGRALGSYERTSFESAAFDRERLTGFVEQLTEGYRLFRVGVAEIERFAAFDDSLAGNFRDLDHFLEAGLGFAIEHDGEIVAGCSSFTQAEGEVKIEIDTAKEHRRRGLALATGSALILHCLAHGLLPCWDAANEESARLAGKLGFTEPLTYEVWFLRKPADAVTTA
jgi:GNAT superfamily N-acetyltransferase